MHSPTLYPKRTPGYIGLWVLLGVVIVLELRHSKGSQAASRRHEDLPQEEQQVADDVDGSQPQGILNEATNQPDAR